MPLEHRKDLPADIRSVLPGETLTTMVCSIYLLAISRIGIREVTSLNRDSCGALILKMEICLKTAVRAAFSTRNPTPAHPPVITTTTEILTCSLQRFTEQRRSAKRIIRFCFAISASFNSTMQLPLPNWRNFLQPIRQPGLISIWTEIWTW